MKRKDIWRYKSGTIDTNRSGRGRGVFLQRDEKVGKRQKQKGCSMETGGREKTEFQGKGILITVTVKMKKGSFATNRPLPTLVSQESGDRWEIKRTSGREKN